MCTAPLFHPELFAFFLFAVNPMEDLLLCSHMYTRGPGTPEALTQHFLLTHTSQDLLSSVHV